MKLFSSAATPRRRLTRYPARMLTSRLPARAGYPIAIASILAATALIGVVLSRVRLENLAMVYVLVVLWLATSCGRGPAVLASVLSFFAYDYFFIPPLHRLNVADPAEWLSLLVLLATSLVTGHLTAAMRARAREARDSQQQTAQLYDLAQLIASAPDQQSLYDAAVTYLLQVFGGRGVEACALLLPGESNWPRLVACATPTEALRAHLEQLPREQRAQAAWTLTSGTVVGGPLAPEGTGALAAAQTDDEHRLLYFVPLQAGTLSVGIIALVGGEALRALVSAGTAGGTPTPTRLLACCRQIALALDHAALREQTIHVEAIRESDRLKTALLGSVTHDLRTPIAAIKAATTSLLTSEVSATSQERADLLSAIDAGADRLHRLVSNLLDLSRLEAGVAAPDRRWYPLGDVLSTVLDRLELTGQLQGREIDMQVPDALPLLLLDHMQIEQVMTNLLENAVKYSPEESPIRIAARVLPSAAPADEGPTVVEVRVTDRGIGIAPGELTAIFDKFYRVQYAEVPWLAAHPPTGTGLGLAICEGLVRGHGGRIWAESAVSGEGATFVFTLPVPQSLPPGRLPELALDERTASALPIAHIGERSNTV